MRREKLGDGLDWGKRGLIQLLRAKCAVRRLAILPMITDVGGWSSPEQDSYVSMFGLEQGETSVLSWAPWTDPQESDVAKALDQLAMLPDDFDVFADANTGLEPRVASPTADHFPALWLPRFLTTEPDRLLLIYQHGRRKKLDGSLKDRGEHLRELLTKPSYAALNFLVYASQNGGFIAASTSKSRVDKVRAAVLGVVGDVVMAERSLCVP